MNEGLLAAVARAIDTAEAEEARQEILSVQAQAAVKAVEAFGYILPAGHEYAVIRGDVTEEVGFNTRGQAERFATSRFPDGDYIISHRPVGVWEEVEAPGLPSGNPEDTTKGEGNV